MTLLDTMNAQFCDAPCRRGAEWLGAAEAADPGFNMWTLWNTCPYASWLGYVCWQAAAIAPDPRDAGYLRALDTAIDHWCGGYLSAPETDKVSADEVRARIRAQMVVPALERALKGKWVTP